MEYNTDSARRFHETTPWARSQTFLQAAVEDLFSHCQPSRVLDLGGGTGLLGSRFIGLPNVEEVVIVDNDAARLTFAPNSLTKVKCDISEVANLGQFDVILLRQVLHYLKDPAGDLSQLRRSLRRGGVIYVGQLTTPTERSAIWLGEVAKMLPDNGRLRAYSTAGLISHLQQSGLVPRSLRSYEYQESVESWVMRSGASSKRRAILDQARARLTREIAVDLAVEDPGLHIKQNWFHGIWSLE